MDKPVVKYEGKPYFMNGMAYGIRPVNHPRSNLNGYEVRTSTVVKYDEATGEIETLNTLYRPA